MGLFGDPHGFGGELDETWHSYTLPKKDPKKYMYQVTHPLISTDISIFSPEISKFCYIKKYRCRLRFDT